MSSAAVVIGTLRVKILCTIKEKSLYAICEQQMPKSAYASGQSDQGYLSVFSAVSIDPVSD